jgi:predicted PhzF superfamily epimerase YddE/YHI9
MAQEIFQVDAFTDRPFKGNPAAVCIMPQEGDVQWMQCLANEMNLFDLWMNRLGVFHTNAVGIL